MVVCSEGEEPRVTIVCAEAVSFDGEIVGSDFVCNMFGYRDATKKDIRTMVVGYLKMHY